MNEELKVRSFRADNETFEKFKQLAEGEFGNQGQCLSALINLYETETSKAVLVNRGLEIESFQDYMNKISSLFLTSLQLNQDAEGRIREEFARQLESKDRTIIDLQTKINDLTTAKEAFQESSKCLKEENTELRTNVSDLENTIYKQKQDFTSALSDKDSLNKALTDSLNERKAEIETLREFGADANEQLKKLESIEAENKRLKTGFENLENEIERQKELAEIAKDKAVTILEKEHQKSVGDLNEQHNSKIQDLLEKIEKLHERIQERKDNSKKNIEGKKEQRTIKSDKS
jgi:chromosome segregation ATPase